VPKYRGDPAVSNLNEDPVASNPTKLNEDLAGRPPVSIWREGAALSKL